MKNRVAKQIQRGVTILALALTALLLVTACVPSPTPTSTPTPPVIEPEPTPTPTPSPTPAPRPTPTYEEIPSDFTTYTHEGLFSISYPSGWELATSVMEEVWQEVQREMKTEDPDLALEAISLLFLGGKPTQEGWWYPTVSIVTDVRFTGYWTVAEVYEANSLYERENTPGYKELSISRPIVDGREAIIIDSEDNEPGYGRWRYIQMATVKGDFVWIVSCSAEYQDFDDYEETFYSIVKSLRILH